MAPKTERQKLDVPIGTQLGNLDLGGPSERNKLGGTTYHNFYFGVELTRARPPLSLYAAAPENYC